MPIIEIVRAPEGEAPLWVREAWIGIQLEVLQDVPEHWMPGGVLTGQRVNRIGYPVSSQHAFEMLKGVNLGAWAWWLEHCTSYVTRDVILSFSRSACREVVFHDQT